MNRSLIFGFVLCLSFLAVGFALGNYLQLNTGHSADLSGAEKREKLPGKLISPLLECAEPATYTIGKYNDLEEKIKTLVQSRIDHGDASEVAVYFRDLNNGPWFGINEGLDFAPASLLKLPLMMTYYKAAEDEHIKLEETITISSKEAELGQPIQQFIQPEVSLEANKSYTINQIIDNMITYSDNIAWFGLVDHLDPDLLKSIYTDLGLPFPSVKTPSDFISVRKYSSFFRVLYNASYINEEMSEKALRLLTKSKFRDGLIKGVPYGVTVAHKFGERRVDETTRQFHDCGIIYHPKNPYILCVMTQGLNFSSLINVIQDISKTTYDQLK